MDDPAGESGLTAASGAAPLIPDGLDATLVLVRHGESTYIVEGRFQGQADAPLSPTGLRQASLVGPRLARPHEPPALPVPSGAPLELAHSPLSRTTATAVAIESALGAAGMAPERRPDAGLLEIHQGVWQGLHREEIQQLYGAELAAWRRSPVDAWAPGGESLPEVQGRLRPALARILERLAEVPGADPVDRPHVPGSGDPAPSHPWSIVVGHDGVFKVALLTLFDIPLERFWMWSMDLCGITVIEFRAGRAVLRAHDRTDHLAEMREPSTTEGLAERSEAGAL